jgi:hypothetical protein
VHLPTASALWQQAPAQQALVQSALVAIPSQAQSALVVATPVGVSGSYNGSLERAGTKKRKVDADPTPAPVASSPAGQVHDGRLLEIAQQLQHPMSSLQRNNLQTELAQLEGRSPTIADTEYQDQPSSDSSDSMDEGGEGDEDSDAM